MIVLLADSLFLRMNNAHYIPNSLCLAKNGASITKLPTNPWLYSTIHTNYFYSIKFDSGYKFTSDIRSSPAFWEKKNKDLLALVPTLGNPTLFLTLSSAEIWWPELLSALVANVGRKLSLKEALELAPLN